MDSTDPAGLSIPIELVTAGTSGHLVILVGAGASLAAGLPTWKGLLTALFQRARAASLTAEQATSVEDAEVSFGIDDLVGRASFLQQTLGGEWLANEIVAIVTPHDTPSPSHDALADIEGAAFITTNYDRLLEKAIKKRVVTEPHVVYVTNSRDLLDFAAGDVLKLHGDIAAPETIVLTTEDYFRVSYAAGGAWQQRLQALLQKPHALVLVGYGYGDVDVQHVVNQLRAAFQGALPGPFWLTCKDTPSVTKANAAGLRPIWIETHDDAPRWLRALASAIEQKKKQSPVFVKAVAYARQLQQKHREAQQAAGELFQRGQYSSAEAAYRALLTDAQALLPDDPTDGELLRLAASTRANIGACLLCLQRNEDARVLLNEVADRESDNLDEDGRVLLAEALAQLGERNRVQALLERTDAASSPTSGSLEIRQLLELFDGRSPPEAEGRGPIIGLWMARDRAANAEFAEAYRIAASVAAANHEHALVRLHATHLMIQALVASVHEQGVDAVWIPLTQRATAVEGVEEGLIWLDGSLKEAALGDLLVQLKRSFYILTRDDDRLSSLTPPDLDPGANEPFVLAQRLARGGNLQDALDQLDPAPQEWIANWERYYLQALSGDVDGALAGAQALSRRFPDKAPLEYFLAKLLRSAARSDEALSHARAAFAALPGRGYRLLLARCLIGAGLSAEAAAILLPFGESGGDAVLKARAMSLEDSDPNAAIDLWRRYLDRNPDDVSARLKVPELLLGSGRRQDAAEEAWALFESREGDLDPAVLYRCAQYQRLSEPLDADARDRVAAIGRVLATRHRSNPSAQGYRFMVDTMLDLESEEAPDYAALVDAGVLQPASLDEVIEELRRRSTLHDQAYTLYRRAQLPFECLCELTQTPAAQYVVRAAEVALAHGPAVLSAPAGLPEAAPLLSGQRVLIGELEALLLQHLGLFGRLRECLGTRGRLVIFHDVRQRIVESAANVELGTQRVALDKESELLRFLKSHSKVEVTVADASTTDAAWSVSLGVPLVDSQAPSDAPILSARALVQRLADLGKIEQVQAEALLSAFLREPEGTLPLPAILPERLVLGFVALRVFSDLGVLNAVIDLIPNRVVIGPSTMAVLEGRLQGLQRTIAAADLASATNRSIGDGVARGWIEATLRRPEIQGLPQVADAAEHQPLLYRDPIAKAYAFREALANDADLWLLSADSFAYCPLGSHPDLVTKLAWPTPSAFLAFGERLRTASAREFRLPALVTAMLSGARLEKTLSQLLELGFPDALRAEDIAKLDLRFGGLRKDEPTRLLGRAELISRDRDHALVGMATIGLAFTYANAIWLVFQQDQLVDAARTEEIADTLLSRAEAMSIAALDLTLQAVITVIASNPKQAFFSAGETATLSMDSASGRLWKHLYTFSQGGGLRRPSYARALRRLWLLVDELFTPNGPGRVQCAPLLLSMQVAPSHLLQPELDAAAILSANWETRPLRELTVIGSEGPDVEEFLVQLAALLGTNPAAVMASASALHEVPTTEVASIVAAPPEAVLLRATTKAAVNLAGFLARAQGVHDGKAYTLLSRLESDPSNPAIRRELARNASRAPWRLTREDPLSLASWGAVARYGDSVFPDSIAELRALLSEPVAGVHQDESLWKEIAARVAEGGLWHRRTDVVRLFEASVGVPGMLPGASAEMRLASERYTSELSATLARLKRPNAMPSTHLASDIFFLRFAATRKPQISLDGTNVDLREELPELLRSIIVACVREPRPDAVAPSESTEATAPAGSVTLADAEAPILRMCLQVVQDLCHGYLIPIKQGLWLGYRLFEWFWLQLEEIPAAHSSEAFTAFIKTDPGARDLPSGVDDLLNPFCFSPERFDHRLATVLYAVAAMDDLVRVFDAPKGEEHHLKPSERLQDLLLEIASRTLSPFESSLRLKGDKPSCLDWYATGAIPDLALAALLRLCPNAFFRMDPDARARWIQDLATGPDDRERLGWNLSVRLFGILTLEADALTPDERLIFEGRLRALEEVADPRIPAWKWFGFTHLLAAGQKSLMAEAASMLSEHLTHGAAPASFGLYMSAVARDDVERVRAEAARIFDEAAALSLDLVPFTICLANSASSGPQAAGAAMLDALREAAKRPALELDERMKQLMTLVGDTTESS